MYIKTQNAHSTINGKYTEFELGKIKGDYRTITAVVADDTLFDSINDNIVQNNCHVFNFFDKQTGKAFDMYLDSLVVIGADDLEQAEHIAERMLDSMEANHYTLLETDNIDCWSMDSLNKLLSNPIHDVAYNKAITANQLETESNRVTFQQVQWDGIQLVSHDKRTKNLLRDLIKCDTQKHLTEKFDLSSELMALEVSDPAYDSLISTKEKLPTLKQQLFKAMEKVSSNDLQVTNADISKPYKRFGTTNITMVFHLSDGQSVTIWFNNPDSTPNQIKASDILNSWRWQLNKLDVTGALQPTGRQAPSIDVLAKRIMQLAGDNSKRFVRTQERKAETQKALNNITQKVAEKQARIEQLDSEIADVQEQIDSAKNQNNKSDNVDISNLEDKLQSSVQMNGKVNLEPLPEDIEYSEIKKAIEKVFKENLRDKIVFCPPLSSDVTLRNSSGKNILNKSANRIKMQLLLKVGALLASANTVREDKVDSGNRNITNTYLVKSKVTINGELKTVGMRVHKDHQEKYLYDMFVQIQGKKSSKNDKSVAVPAGEASNEAVRPALYHASDENNSTTSNEKSSQFDKMTDDVATGEYVINLFFDDEITDLEDSPAEEENSTQHKEDKSMIEELMEENKDKTTKAVNQLLGANNKSSEQSQEQKDIDYLKDVIAGKFDMATGEFADKLIEVVERVGEDDELAQKAMVYYEKVSTTKAKELVA